MQLTKHKLHVDNPIHYTCLLCGKNIKKHENYNAHVAKHKTNTPGVFMCLHRSCQQLFQNAQDLKRHTEEVHKDQFQCAECLNHFTAKRSVLAHKVSNSLRGVLSVLNCNVCDKAFDKTGDLEQHMLSHEFANPGIVTDGEQTFASPGDLKQHQDSSFSEELLLACDFPGCNSKIALAS